MVSEGRVGKVVSHVGKKILGQLGRYLFASTMGTIAHYLTLFGLVHFFALDLVVASTYGAVVGAVIIYKLSYSMVFKSDRSHREAFLRFSLVTCLSIFLNGTILKLLVFVLPWHYLALQVLTTLSVFVGNFILNRIWTFSETVPG